MADTPFSRELADQQIKDMDLSRIELFDGSLAETIRNMRYPEGTYVMRSGFPCPVFCYGCGAKLDEFVVTRGADGEISGFECRKCQPELFAQHEL